MRNKLNENHILVKTPTKQGDYHKPYTCTRYGYKHGDRKDSYPAVGKYVDSATNKIISKRYVVKQRPLTMYAFDNGYYSDEGKEYYAESIQMELHVIILDHEQLNGQKLFL